MAGDEVTYIGMVLSGSVNVMQEDFWGSRTILGHMRPGDLFAESFSCAEIKKMPVSVVALEDSQILLIDYRRIISTCSANCVFHSHLVKNMVHILAEKNIMLTEKMEHVSRRTIREKLLSYLSATAAKKGGNHIDIPFNRQELADYLYIDRSALSRELSLMKKDGLIDYDKNEFVLLS